MKTYRDAVTEIFKENTSDFLIEYCSHIGNCNDCLFRKICDIADVDAKETNYHFTSDKFLNSEIPTKHYTFQFELLAKETDELLEELQALILENDRLRNLKITSKIITEEEVKENFKNT